MRTARSLLPPNLRAVLALSPRRSRPAGFPHLPMTAPFSRGSSVEFSTLVPISDIDRTEGLGEAPTSVAGGLRLCDAVASHRVTSVTRREEAGVDTPDLAQTLLTTARANFTGVEPC